jgi:hypothetical protein
LDALVQLWSFPRMRLPPTKTIDSPFAFLIDCPFPKLPGRLAEDVVKLLECQESGLGHKTEKLVSCVGSRVRIWAYKNIMNHSRTHHTVYHRKAP